MTDTPPDPFADLILPDATLRELRAIVEDWRHPDPPTRVLLVDPPDGTTEALLGAVMDAGGIDEFCACDVREVMAEAVSSGDRTVADVHGRLSDHASDLSRVGIGAIAVDAGCHHIGGDHVVSVLMGYAIDRLFAGKAAFVVATAQHDIGWRGCFDVVVYPGAWEAGELVEKIETAIGRLLDTVGPHGVNAGALAQRIGSVSGLPDLRRAAAYLRRAERTGETVTTESLAWAMGVPMGDGL